tara:strand:+ start:4403 stop:4915 length:513 start_codon:yes stop_codon:yes gene_type:complete
MALFGGERDISLFRKMNRELINKLVDTTVDILKSSIKDMDENLYGEVLGKEYFQNVRLGSLIEPGGTDIVNSEFGPDITKTCTFNFLRDDLVDIPNLKLEMGDIIKWDNIFWECDKVSSSNQYFAGKNPQHSHAGDKFGWKWGIVAETHMTRRRKIEKSIKDTGYDKDLY